MKKAIKLESGSKEPNKNKVGKVSKEQIRQIAETKLKDLNCTTIEAAISQVEGTAKSMGLEIGK